MTTWTPQPAARAVGRFGSELQRQREARKISQRQLAAATGIERSSIVRYEQGERHPAAEVVALLAEALALDWPATCQLYVCAGLLPPGEWVALDGWVIRPDKEAQHAVRPEPAHDEPEGETVSPGRGAAGVVA